MPAKTSETHNIGRRRSLNCILNDFWKMVESVVLWMALLMALADVFYR